MGRGSQKKVKKNALAGSKLMYFGLPKSCETGDIYYLSEQMMAELKRLNPCDVAMALLSDDVKASDN